MKIYEAYNLPLTCKVQQKQTLKREPIDENFVDLEDSSGEGGNKLETKEHWEAPSRA